MPSNPILIEEDHIPTKQAWKEMLQESNLAGLLVYFIYVFFHASSRMLLCFHVFMLFSSISYALSKLVHTKHLEAIGFSILKTNTKYGF
jgi:hypothetical protein